MGVYLNSGNEGFKSILNSIYLDITWFLSRSKSNGRDIVDDIQISVIEELHSEFPGCIREGEKYLPDALLAVAFMTGILPIKKYGTQSALTDFREFTMTDPMVLAEYVGFTECEVQALCDQFQMNYEEMKRWYDGYVFPEIRSVYSPNSVISAIKYKRFKNECKIERR